MTTYIVMKIVGYRNMDSDNPIEEVDSVYLDKNKAELRLAKLDREKEYEGFTNWIKTQEVTE